MLPVPFAKPLVDPPFRSLGIVSADATAGQIRRLLACGALAYLTKPLDVHEVRRVVDELLHDHVVQEGADAPQD